MHKQIIWTVLDHNFLFPEFEIVIEIENEIMPEVVEKEDKSEIIGSMGEAPEEELDSKAKHESREDGIFQKFKISLEPEQVMPQLLNELKADRLGRVLTGASWPSSPVLKALD